MHQYNPNRKTQKCGKVLKNFFSYLGHFPIALGWWSSSGGGSRRWWSSGGGGRWWSGGSGGIRQWRSGDRPVGQQCRCDGGPTVAAIDGGYGLTVAVAGGGGPGTGQSSSGGSSGPAMAIGSGYGGGPVMAVLVDRRWGGPTTSRRGDPVTDRSAGGVVVRRPAGRPGGEIVCK
ncbi:hypothetical protein Q3G72_025232 [Acer saccharum]|nr:hypothetical protein Q3G72_025232 [Acer saccharum]